MVYRLKATPRIGPTEGSYSQVVQESRKCPILRNRPESEPGVAPRRGRNQQYSFPRAQYFQFTRCERPRFLVSPSIVTVPSRPRRKALGRDALGTENLPVSGSNPCDVFHLWSHGRSGAKNATTEPAHDPERHQNDTDRYFPYANGDVCRRIENKHHEVIDDRQSI